jgi:hypothetical protein
MLGRLNITCDNRNQGCNELITLEKLNDHLIVCKYKQKDDKCNICNCIKLNSGHNCVTSLLELTRQLRENNDEANKSVLGELKQLRLEKENFLKTIQELSNMTENNGSTIKTHKPDETV